MACHLDGGICPHDYPMGKGSSYPVSGSSSYGGGSSYAALGAYVPQTTSQKSSGMKNTSPIFDVYRSNDRQRESTQRENNQDVPELLREPRDVARRVTTIDDTVASNAVAIQRDFLEQMIRNARLQITPQQQPQYLALY